MAGGPSRSWPIVVRRVRPDDKAAVLDFSTRTWNGWDYIPSVFDDWVAAQDGIFLAATPGDGASLDRDRPIAVARIAILTETEAWIEGIRVDPRVRGLGIATDLQVAELRWAAAHGAHTVRYLTGESNDVSLRLGARHGFAMVGHSRWYGWDTDSAAEPPAPAPVRDGADAPETSPARTSTVPGESIDAWWSAIASDATFQAASRLYEPRSWALAELTRDRFAAHVAAGEVMIWQPDGNRASVPTTGAWGLTIARPGPEGEDDPRLPPAPALVAGSAHAVLGLLRILGNGRPGLPEVRLPDPDPPMLRGGARDTWAAAGWASRGHSTHILARPIDDAHPLPEPDDAALLIYAEEPRVVAAPRRQHR